MLDMDRLINMKAMGILTEGEFLIVVNNFRAEQGLTRLDDLPEKLKELLEAIECLESINPDEDEGCCNCNSGLRLGD